MPLSSCGKGALTRTPRCKRRIDRHASQDMSERLRLVLGNQAVIPLKGRTQCHHHLHNCKNYSVDSFAAKQFVLGGGGDIANNSRGQSQVSQSTLCLVVPGTYVIMLFIRSVTLSSTVHGCISDAVIGQLSSFSHARWHRSWSTMNSVSKFCRRTTICVTVSCPRCNEVAGQYPQGSVEMGSAG